MRFHWQNLSDEPGNERHGFWHGRAWLRPFDDGGPVVKACWHHGRTGLALSVDFDRDERAITLHVKIPGASWFLGAAGLPRRLFDRLPFSLGRTEYRYMGSNRMIGVRVFDEKIWLSLWEDRDEWRAKDPKWMRATIAPFDIVFGRQKYETRVIEEREVSIPMPEKLYPATAKRKVSSWTRPRWPWRPLSVRRSMIEIDVPGGVGVPGKGENSWDIDDDAIFSMSAAARTIEEGIGKLVASAMETRRRRGWKNAPRAEAAP